MTTECKNCEKPPGEDGVCDECRRDPATNNCQICGHHLEGINYPYVCEPCMRKEWEAKLAGKPPPN